MSGELVAKPRYRVRAGTSPLTTTALDQRQAPYVQYNREPNTFLQGFMPMLREQSDVVGGSWEKQAARVIHGYQHSGFIRGVLDVSTAQVVGSGLRMSAQPDIDTLGWSKEFAAEFSRQRESSFQAWASNPYHCDASAQMNFGQQQQAYYWCALAFGEGLALNRTIERPGSKYLTKFKLLPPSRISNTSDGMNLVQGVRIDDDGMPIAIRLLAKNSYGALEEREVPVRDRHGFLRVIHRFMPAVAQTRNVADIATGMKAYRQFEQYSDANLTKKLIQTIFAAVVKSNLQGLAAFEGLMTETDQVQQNAALDVAKFGDAKAGWYDGSKIDLASHGRIAHLFPNDELDFVESKAAGDEFDPIARWLWLEIAAAAGVSYESATGDYRGATYSSVRMAGSKEWLGVIRRRDGLIVPFCQEAADSVLEEDIATGRIKIPGGLDAFYENRDAICRAKWAGPRQPQADDFKTARAHEVRKSMGATTLDEIFTDYGMDWDDALHQQARENELAERLGLPLPWAPTDPLQTREGQEAELNDPDNDGQEKRNPPSKKRRGAKDDPERDPEDALAEEIESDLETE
ncbi:phage portal protein [Devosia sp. FJ2-5-3]|uniref:phage portal protein n=1 Tax=Devosia sp. FJ2-5-3 TaxID=2976680 RepID=UPI0023D8804D|nr:phage portal protein [Devosia sp. FJ2-5-3]WEJ60228.1 phage portal protein [Devosia sp. FJ2-5-3]